MKNMYVLEYSVTKGEWNIQKVSSMLKMNIFNYMKDRQSSYLPLAIAETLEEIEQIKRQFIEEKLIPTSTFH